MVVGSAVDDDRLDLDVHKWQVYSNNRWHEYPSPRLELEEGHTSPSAEQVVVHQILGFEEDGGKGMVLP